MLGTSPGAALGSNISDNSNNNNNNNVRDSPLERQQQQQQHQQQQQGLIAPQYQEQHDVLVQQQQDLLRVREQLSETGGGTRGILGGGGSGGDSNPFGVGFGASHSHSVAASGGALGNGDPVTKRLSASPLGSPGLGPLSMHASPTLRPALGTSPGLGPHRSSAGVGGSLNLGASALSGLGSMKQHQQQNPTQAQPPESSWARKISTSEGRSGAGSDQGAGGPTLTLLSKPKSRGGALSRNFGASGGDGTSSGAGMDAIGQTQEQLQQQLQLLQQQQQQLFQQQQQTQIQMQEQHQQQGSRPSEVACLAAVHEVARTEFPSLQSVALADSLRK